MITAGSPIVSLRRSQLGFLFSAGGGLILSTSHQMVLVIADPRLRLRWSQVATSRQLAAAIAGPPVVSLWWSQLVFISSACGGLSWSSSRQLVMVTADQLIVS